jgi:hypothetical protein
VHVRRGGIGLGIALGIALALVICLASAGRSGATATTPTAASTPTATTTPTGQPIALSFSPAGNLLLSYTGPAGVRDVVERAAGGSWYGPFALGAPGSVPAPVQATPPGLQDIAAEGPAHSLVVTWRGGPGRSSTGQWAVSASAGTIYSAPSVAADAAGDLYVAAQGPTHSLVVAVLSRDGRWTAPVQVPGTAGTVDPPGASAALSVGLGIGDIFTSELDTPVSSCPTGGAFACFQDIAAGLTGGQNRFRYARIMVPWDTVAGADCVEDESVVQTTVDGVTQPWFGYLTGWLAAAHAAGLAPLIAIRSDAPGSGRADPADPNPLDPTAAQYRCAFTQLVAGLRAWAVSAGVPAPGEFEVYNEPDAPGLAADPTCQSERPTGWSGPRWGAAQCAALFYQQAQQAGLGVTLVAGAFNDASTADPEQVFVRAYLDYLTGTLHQWPAVWSAHPYDAVTAGALHGGSPGTGLQTLDRALYDAYPPGQPLPTVWVTEADDYFTDPDVDARGTLTAALQTQPAQGLAAAAFLALPSVSAAGGPKGTVAVTREYWWDFAQLAADPAYSGLVDAPGAGRQEAFCVLAGETPAQADDDSRCQG